MLQLKQTGITITEGRSKCFVESWGTGRAEKPKQTKTADDSKNFMCTKGIMDNKSMEKQNVNGNRSKKYKILEMSKYCKITLGPLCKYPCTIYKCGSFQPLPFQ